MDSENSRKRRKLNNGPTSDTENVYYRPGGNENERLGNIRRFNGACAPLREKRVSPLRTARLRPADDPDAFNPDVFKLQVDELLAETKPQLEPGFESARPALRRVKDVIESIAASGPLPVRSLGMDTTMWD